MADAEIAMTGLEQVRRSRNDIKPFAEKSGLITQFARTGDDVLELAKRRPALIVLDPELPGKVRGCRSFTSLRSDSQPITVIIVPGSTKLTF